MCSSNLGFSVENTNHGLVWGTYYVPATYVPGISRLIDTSQKKSLRACARARVPCVRVSLVLVWKTLILVLVWDTYYVPATYVPGISRQTTVWYQVRTYNIGLRPKSPQKSLRACAQTFCASNLRFTGENTNIRTYMVSARMYPVAGY